MARLRVKSAAGVTEAEVSAGEVLADALRRLGQAPDMPCGGSGRCGKCRVLARGKISPPAGTELEMLSAEELGRGVRLACRVRIEGDAEAELIESGTVSRICTEGVLGSPGGDPMFKNLGIAADIGTTTLAVSLCGKSGPICSVSAPNPQRSWGADVISRVGKAMHGEDAALASSVRTAVAQLVREAAESAGRDCAGIDAYVITGNTAMLHLFTRTDPSPLAASPFEAKELFGRAYPAESFGLPCAPGAQAYLPRCMSAFVGADISTALISSGICSDSGTALLTDIGTNGEAALWKDRRLLCCSTAAGPAFEGANLSSGMQGTDGAVDHAEVRDGKIRIHVIGDAPAAGICGSGVADLLAALLELEILDETGYLECGDYEFAENVKFTQKDVRQVQLAKSAIRSGIETLIHTAHAGKKDISRMAVAGGFGSYLSLESAAAIGLIPPELKDRCSVIGNAALSGAVMMLFDKKLADESSRLADSAETIDLAPDPFFMDQYVENMMF